jgi:hypothetical protein
MKHNETDQTNMYGSGGPGNSRNARPAVYMSIPKQCACLGVLNVTNPRPDGQCEADARQYATHETGIGCPTNQLP